MGIFGLRKFLTRETRGSRKSLSDPDWKNLVIDGSNLKFILYGSCDVSGGRYGGEYDLYQAHVMKFFRKLSSEGIKSYVVFDGFAKKHTGIQDNRADKEVKRVKKIIDGTAEKNEMVFPCLEKEVLVACLKKLEKENKLYYCFIDGDADPVIAGLAKALECPVLSNDTDFILYDLPPQCGLILLDQEFINTIISKRSTVTTSYHRSDIAKEYTLVDEESLKLLSITCDEEWLQTEPELSNCLKKELDTLDIKKSIDWLKNHEKYSEKTGKYQGLKGIIKKISKLHEDRSGVKKKMKAKISIYGQQNTKLMDMIKSYMMSEESDMFYDEEQYKHILEISDWRRYRKGLFPNQAVLLMSTDPIHNTITHTLHPQMENLKKKSAWECSRTIRSYAQNNVANYSDTAPAKKVIKVIERNAGSMETHEVETNSHNTKEELPALFKPCFGLSEDQGKAVEQQWQQSNDEAIMMAMIFGWVNNADPKISMEDLLAILEMYINGQDPNYSETKDLLTQHYTLGEHIDIVHSLSQLQTVFHDTFYLLSVLKVDHEIQIDQVICGRKFFWLRRQNQDEVEQRKEILEQSFAAQILNNVTIERSPYPPIKMRAKNNVTEKPVTDRGRSREPESDFSTFNRFKLLSGLNEET